MRRNSPNLPHVKDVDDDFKGPDIESIILIHGHADT
jgi:hypothetical protein